LDHEERKRKKEAREVHRRAEFARKAIGIKGKMFAKKRHAEKAQMKKTIAMHEEKDSKKKAEDGAPQNALPAYLLERDQVGSGMASSHLLSECVCGSIVTIHSLKAV
jgi:ribosome biogenesis protein NSA2